LASHLLIDRNATAMPKQKLNARVRIGQAGQWYLVCYALVYSILALYVALSALSLSLSHCSFVLNSVSTNQSTISQFFTVA